MIRPMSLALMAAASLGLTPAAMAQTANRATVDDEVSVTRALNAEVSRRLHEADRKEAADAAAHREAMARYEGEMARYNTAREQHAESLRQRQDHIAQEQELYNQRMADWRATVTACEAGDRVRCESGKAPVQPQPPH